MSTSNKSRGPVWSFTKMHGTGNDFVVLDGIQQSLVLNASVIRYLANRQLGVGADQVLVVERTTRSDADFRYRIFNADGSEVEHCGNGARCFYRYIQDKGLSQRAMVRAEIKTGVIALSEDEQGMVIVSMGYVSHDHEAIGFNERGLTHRVQGDSQLWLLDDVSQTVEVSVLSLSNPHAMQVVEDVVQYPVSQIGPQVSNHPRFINRINAGFMQVLDKHSIALRVYERGAGETLACGTGACAAVVMGIERGLLESPVQVQMQGGVLKISYEQGVVVLAGPTATVFDGQITVPNELIND